jgi:hypothetical protein
MPGIEAVAGRAIATQQSCRLGDFSTLAGLPDEERARVFIGVCMPVVFSPDLSPAQRIELRNQTKAQVEEVVQALDGKLESWCQSAAVEWEYVNASVGDFTCRVGVSLGGVVSVNGDPFTVSTREMVTSTELIRQSITERISRGY